MTIQTPLGPTLETARLILRPPIAADFEGFVAMMADPETARFIGGVMAPAAVWRGFMSMAGAWALDGFAMFSVVEKSSNRWIGRIGPWRPHGWPGTEIGWGLLPDAMGKGYAVEAASASIDWAIDHLGWTDIIHCIDPENTPSQAVAMRLGAVNRGPGRLPAPFEAATIDLWGQSAAQWRGRARGEA